MSKQARTQREPTHEEIAARAQRIYEQEGRPDGRDMQHWLQAEKQLKAEAGATASGSQNPTAAKSSNWQQQSPRQPVTHN